LRCRQGEQSHEGPAANLITVTAHAQRVMTE
jgi:hypothetical protein